MKGHSLRKKEYIDPQFIYFLMISLITTLHLVLISRSNVPFFCYLLYSFCSSLSLFPYRHRRLEIEKISTNYCASKKQSLVWLKTMDCCILETILIYIFLHYFWSFLDSMYPFLSHVCVCTRRGSYKMIFKVGVLCEVDISKCHIKSKTWAEKWLGIKRILAF